MTRMNFMPRMLIIIAIILSISTSAPVVAATNKDSVKHIVEIRNMSFHPAELDVRAGDIVTWINRDFVPHNVSPTGAIGWRSPNMVKGDMFSLVIDVGLPYMCTLHRAYMAGSITIIDGD